MKRFVALVLSLVMALSLCAPAWGEGAASSVASYDELVAAIAAASDGDTITLTGDITASEAIVVNKAITLDGAKGDGTNYTLYSSAGRAINVNCAGNVTIKNLTIEASGERAINVIQKPATVVIDNVTATANNYTVNVAGSAGAAKVAITNSILTGLCTVNVASAGAEVTVDNCTVNCDDNNTTAGESYAALALGYEAVDGKIVATNTTINVAEGSDSVKGRNSAVGGLVTINGSTDDVIVMVAAIFYGTSPYYHGFSSLEKAAAFAKASDTITLYRDVTLTSDVTLPCQIEVVKDITIDLNGKTITSSGNGPLFDVKGNLTVKNGTITSTGSGAVFYGNNGSTAGKGTSEAELTLIDLTVTAASYFVYSNTSVPGWNKVTITGGNYTNTNKGFTIDMAWDGVVTMTDVVAKNTGSGVLLEVGGYGYATATITDCDLTAAGTGVMGYTVGASYGTQMTINGGTYTGADIVAQAHETTYNGGPVPTVTINSGSFTGKLENSPSPSNGEGKIVVSGGYFNTAPSADYIAEGKAVIPCDKTGYPYTIGVKKTDVEVVVAAPDVTVSSKITDEDELEAAEAIANGGVEISDEALKAQATTVANDDKTKVTDDITEKLEDVLDKNITKTEVVIVVKPYFDVTVKDVDLSGTTPTIKLDITPMYQKVATTEEVLDSGDEIVATEGTTGRNAVAVGRPTKIQQFVTGAVEITINIPDDLADAATDGKLYVTHNASSGKYVYEATVIGSAGNYTATFTNTHGFSSFTVAAENNIVASIGNDNYTSLQDALDAVKDGQTIVVHKSNVAGETVKGSKKYEFTVDLANGVDNVTIENNGTDTTLGNGGSGTFEVAKGSSNSGGSYKPSTGTTTKPSTNKVTSAQTFDAGIAMYVGMSVMAAAGSVVVFKKRED